MKQINLKIAVILISSFTLFSFASNRKSYQTECISMEMDGYITLKIWDSKKGVKYTSEQSRKDAIHAILYSGIAGSKGCTTLSPLLSKMEAQENFKNIEKSFFSKFQTLASLDLSFNDLHSLQNTYFLNLNELKQLYLNL